MSWKTLIPHANTRSHRGVCRMAIGGDGRVTIRASAQIFGEAGITMGDRVAAALGDGEDAGWLCISKADRGWKIGSNASGPDQRATYKLTFTPRRGLFPEVRKSYEVRWEIRQGDMLCICWDEKLAKPRSMEQRSIDPMTEGNARDYSLLVPTGPTDSLGSAIPPVHFPRKEVVPVADDPTHVVAQPPSPEPAAGAVSSDLDPLNLAGIPDGAQVEVLTELTTALAGVAVDQERAQQEEEPLPPEVVDQLSAKARANLKRNPPPPWGAGVLDGASAVAKHGDGFLPLTTPETWKALREIMHAVKAAGATMTRINVPSPGRDRMKLNGEEMTPEECLDKARVIVKEWEAAA